MLGRRDAVFIYCRECSGGSYTEVEKCAVPNCPLYPFRNRSAVKEYNRLNRESKDKKGSEQDDKAGEK